MPWFVPRKIEGDGADDQGAAARAVFGQGLGGDFQPGALESSMHWQVIWPV